MKANKRTSISDSSLFGFANDSDDNEKAASYNLAKFIMTLIDMDRQRQESLQSKPDDED